MNRRRPAWLRSWFERHQTAVSLALHAIGIPISLAGAGVLVAHAITGDWSWWWLGPVLIVVGYLPQYLGHAYEGNEMGEVVLIKKLLGRPYTAVSPRFAERRD